MTCCEHTYVNFANQSVTSVPWTLTANPVIEVLYQQPNGTYDFAVFTNIKRTPTQIIVDHGGPATGVIKILH